MSMEQLYNRVSRILEEARSQVARTVNTAMVHAYWHYPEAERIRVVLDNLSTHSQAALYQRFAPAEARRILSRIEFHFTPKHASWLNMVEIEIGVMVGQCLNRRIADKATLVSEIACVVH